MLLPMVLNLINPLMKEMHIGELLKTNEKTKDYGLVLTAEEAKNIIEVRNNVLHSVGRVELGLEVTKELIENFYTSGYLNEENYVPVLNELQEMFYYFKNETLDKISDQKLIGIMKEYFEKSCGGSIELLKSTLEVFAEDFRRKPLTDGLSEEGDE